VAKIGVGSPVTQEIEVHSYNINLYDTKGISFGYSEIM